MTLVSNYDKLPFVTAEKENRSCTAGWPAIISTLKTALESSGKKKKVIIVECYPGVNDKELLPQLQQLSPDLFIHTRSFFKEEAVIREMVSPDVTDDRVFGYLTRLNIADYLDHKKLHAHQEKLAAIKEGIILIYGTGAGCLGLEDAILVYADLARWEIQLRMRRNEVDNLGVLNRQDSFSEQYKHAFFVDWRVCDRLKRQLMPRWDYVLDTNTKNHPKLVKAKAILTSLEQTVKRPFRVVPFFDPGPWGGQWLKKVCDLDKTEINYAWGFDCVPEENSLLLKFGDITVEIPSINLVFHQPGALLGEKVFARFGDEFPIRFDFLDTMEGGNLSLQVHPLTGYIQEKFGMHYTQDESYYILDATEEACVYLGLKEQVNPQTMIDELKQALDSGRTFDAEKHVAKWPVKKHDHFSIPAGTVHCSGANSVVLEISATPYIFTFKLWDWNRLGLDGKPRPINIGHGEKVIQWDRTESWVDKNILHLTTLLNKEPGICEERTGLHETEFIETRRHWFDRKVHHRTEGGVNVLCLVEGREVVVESPTLAFDPFIVHYAETFIVPAAVGEYTITPCGDSAGLQCATVKAYVR
ncbi:MAG: class I mannose-6-phosphate isomerase [Chitinophagaceae bacterium]|nr:class I mannose-6-phosphate isomerase [Chitinophagaceae bacterium]